MDPVPVEKFFIVEGAGPMLLYKITVENAINVRAVYACKIWFFCKGVITVDALKYTELQVI